MPTKPPTPDVITTVRLPVDLIAAIEKLQDRDGIGTSEQIRRALRRWLTTKGVYKEKVKK